jgi:uncharacterized protein YbjT (DUF2867 family)
MGASLVPRLLERGHSVRMLSRRGSEQKRAPGAHAVTANALDAATFSPVGCDTFVHLVGTPRPAPWKGAQFRSIDLVSLKASVAAAGLARVPHFIYVSVAHPAPVMKAYIEVRTECERIISESGLCATILRPWYVLGPGHWWPLALTPAYWICERLPATRDAAHRLGLVTLDQMVQALVWAVDNQPEKIRLLSVDQIRSATYLQAESSVQ